jgi:hypothetical protein
MMVMNEEATGLDGLCEMRNVDISRYSDWDKGAIFLYDVDYGRCTFIAFPFITDISQIHRDLLVYILNNATNTIHTTRQFQFP